MGQTRVSPWPTVNIPPWWSSKISLCVYSTQWAALIRTPTALTNRWIPWLWKRALSIANPCLLVFAIDARTCDHPDGRLSPLPHAECTLFLAKRRDADRGRHHARYCEARGSHVLITARDQRTPAPPPAPHRHRLPPSFILYPKRTPTHDNEQPVHCSYFLSFEPPSTSV